ncbi:entericidin A/B family lipoprotein [uncultured Sneathiella sp.]|tara:strand:- start:65336 stop:65485 length:150 start_codon:yes stop_codon:yes gene_type:complete
MLTIQKQLRYFVLALFTMSALSLTACETMEGAGKDIEKAGKAIQEEADD